MIYLDQPSRVNRTLSVQVAGASRHAYSTPWVRLIHHGDTAATRQVLVHLLETYADRSYAVQYGMVQTNTAPTLGAEDLGVPDLLHLEQEALKGAKYGTGIISQEAP